MKKPLKVLDPTLMAAKKPVQTKFKVQFIEASKEKFGASSRKDNYLRLTSKSGTNGFTFQRNYAGGKQYI